MDRRYPTGWRAEAACRGMDVTLWFPDKSGAANAKEARAICASCPVRDHCLDEAVADHELVGIWGNTSTSERQQMRGRPKRRHGTLAMYGDGCRCDDCRQAKSAYNRGRRARTEHACPRCGMAFGAGNGLMKAAHMRRCDAPDSERVAS